MTIRTLPPQRALPGRQHRGLSLIELLISMVIGLVVIGVVFANYLTSGTGNNSNSALSQMSEDASMALNFMRKQITQAGYSRPYQLNAKGGMDRLYFQQAIFGCDGAFDNPKAALINELKCKAGDTGPSSIAIAYEADAQNSVLRDTDKPGDCVGAALSASTTGGATPQSYYVAESRLYVGTDSERALSCQGNGQALLPLAGGTLTSSPSPLVNNVFNMRIRYGVADPRPAPGPGVSPLPLAPKKFVAASALGTPAAWTDVVAVRVCIVVRSEQEVMPEKTPYYDCDAVEAAAPAPVTPTDRRLYRAFSTTVMVQNRLGG